MFGKRAYFVIHIDRHVHAEAIENSFKLWESWPSPVRNGAINGWDHQFSCKFCLIRHHTQTSFLFHMKEHHPGKTKDSKFNCPYSCDSSFDSIRAIVKHIKEQHKEKYFLVKPNSQTSKLSKSKKGTSTKNDSNKWRDSTQPDKHIYLTKCNICEQVINCFTLKSHKRKHEKEKEGARKKKKKSYHCAICSVGVKDRSNLRRHFVLHLENNPFVCRFPGCGQKFQDDYYLSKHVKRHVYQLITCEKCGITYKDNQRKQHECIFDESKIKVGDDGRKYNKRVRLSEYKTTTENLNDPKEIHLENKDIGMKNNQLDHDVGSKIKLESVDDTGRFEVESVHFTDKIIETEDGVIHVKGEQLSPMRDVDEDSDEEIAKDSNEVTTVDETNKLSNRIHGPIGLLKLILEDPVYKRLIKEKPEFADLIEDGRRKKLAFICPHCGWYFSRFAVLEQHQKKCTVILKSSRTESNDGNCIQDASSRNFPSLGAGTHFCSTCGYQTSSNEDLQHHMSTEKHGTKNAVKYTCKYGRCGIAFDTTVALEDHVQRIHMAEKKFKCVDEKCNKTYSTQLQLNRHSYRMHGMGVQNLKRLNEGNGKITLKCKKCLATFEDGDEFATHRRKHEYEKYVSNSKCQLCGDEFAGRHSLKRHIISVHHTGRKSISGKITSETSKNTTGDKSDDDSVPDISGF